MKSSDAGGKFRSVKGLNYEVNPLRPSGNYMNHLLSQSVMLHFVFTGFVWFSL
jgi:hypothetical protein